MKPLIDQQACMAATMDAYSDVRRSMGTEQYRDVVKWIECLIAQHQSSMLSCAKEKLPDIQVRLKQLIGLRSSLVDPGGAFTGYTFD